jgi:hypothetical protein
MKQKLVCYRVARIISRRQGSWGSDSVSGIISEILVLSCRVCDDFCWKYLELHGHPTKTETAGRKMCKDLRKRQTEDASFFFPRPPESIYLVTVSAYFFSAPALEFLPSKCLQKCVLFIHVLINLEKQQQANKQKPKQTNAFFFSVSRGALPPSHDVIISIKDTGWGSG